MFHWMPGHKQDDNIITGRNKNQISNIHTYVFTIITILYTLIIFLNLERIETPGYK